MNRKIIYTLLTTLGIVILINVWAAHTAKKFHLISSIPTGLIDGYVVNMDKGYNTWFIGNSTLDNGVILDKVEKGVGKTILKTPMGSATAEAMCLLATKGVNKTAKIPAAIYLFVTKDDFNAKGLRGETSASYIKAMSGQAFKEQFLSSIPLYSYRLTLKKKYEKRFIDFIKGKKDEAKASPAKTTAKDTGSIQETEINETHSAHLINLGKNFTFNNEGFKELAKACKAKGVKLHVIFPPVTKSVPNWQNYYYPKMSYSMVMDSVKNELKNNAISYTDYTDSVPSTTKYFKDEYHLNAYGARVFSDMLISNLNKTKN